MSYVLVSYVCLIHVIMYLVHVSDVRITSRVESWIISCVIPPLISYRVKSCRIMMLQVRELLSAFGPLKSFHLVRDPGSPTSKGYGFCEYLNAAVTAMACEGLHGMQLGDKTLTVRPATDRG